MKDKSTYKFDLFISYSRIPDGMLAKELERFLESFHNDLMPGSSLKELRPLNICIDNSDFNIPPIDETEYQKGSSRDIDSIIVDHLQQAKELLVLCSKEAVGSKWVKQEIQWFIDNRGPGAIRLAFTQGSGPWENKKIYFPESLIKHGLEKNLPYDFRGYDERNATSWQKVPDFKQEMVKLAAHLHGHAPGELYPSWLESELQRSREKSMQMSISARLESLIGDPAHALLEAYEAYQIHPNDKSENALLEAYKIAIYHHYNRRESSLFSGAGPSYLAGRWKQGKVFVKNSPDGRYQLFVTERGKDGAPVGDVYLLSNETMRIVKLMPKVGAGGRVEEVGFSKDSHHVFVTRYFNLFVYSLDGKIIGEYYFGRHTKSPVHIVAGYFQNTHLIAGETKGGLWIVNPFLEYKEQSNSTKMVYREFHGDATIHIDISNNGNRALLVFESGKSQLLELDERGEINLLDILPDGVLYAGFFPGTDDRIITSGKDGIVRLWESKKDKVNAYMVFDALDAAVDWITVSSDQKQLAAVDNSQTIHILDIENRLCLKSLNYKDEIDWGAVRSVYIPEYEFNCPVAKAKTIEPYDETVFDTKNLTVQDDEKWFFTSKKTSEYSSTSYAWRIEGDKALNYEDHVNSITKHQDMLWLHFQHSLNSSGLVYWITGNGLRRFPAKDVSVNTILETDEGCWLGTSKGAFFHNQTKNRLLTALDVHITTIKKIGGRIYLGSKNDGAYIVEDERTVLITEPFLLIRDIKEVAGKVWLLTDLETGGFLGKQGPVYVVDGYLSHPYPSDITEVDDVVEEHGKVICKERKPFDFSNMGNINFGTDNTEQKKADEKE